MYTVKEPGQFEKQMERMKEENKEYLNENDATYDSFRLMRRDVRFFVKFISLFTVSVTF